jgi:hypothetical protein
VNVKFVYTVESGEYSDHQVHAVFTTREGAEEQITQLITHEAKGKYPSEYAMQRSHYTIDRIPFDMDMSDLSSHIRYTHVRMFKDGGLWRSPEVQGSSYISTLGTVIRTAWWERGRKGVGEAFVEVIIGRVDGGAELIEAAIKTANDIRAQLIATDRWPVKGHKEEYL